MTIETDVNPYTAPSPDQVPEPTPPFGIEEVVNFVPIMRRWEFLRFFYNGLLIVLVLFVSLFFYPQQAAEPGYWVLTCIGGLVANLCYFVGPAIEAYGTRFRVWHRNMTILLFLGGLGFTGILAILSIASVQDL